MRQWLQVILLATFLASNCTGQQPAANGSNIAANEAIAAVLNAQVRAWNRGDLKGFMDGYWKSPDLVFASGGQETHGWEPVLKRYQARYQTAGAEMGRLSFKLANGVHVMSADFAYVDGEYHLAMSNGKQSHGYFTLIFRKFPEGWRIVHDRTCAD
jgi:ketosteroid isomerase-like protein